MSSVRSVGTSIDVSRSSASSARIVVDTSMHDGGPNRRHRPANIRERRTILSSNIIMRKLRRRIKRRVKRRAPVRRRVGVGRRAPKRRAVRRRAPVRRRRRHVGGSIIDRLLSSGRLPELHLRGFSGKYNFAGPGTKLEKRIHPITRRPLPHSIPINRLDELAYIHDLAYNNPSHEARRIADNVMIHGMDQIIKDRRTGWRERADTYVTRAVIKTKRALGLGRRRRRVVR